jgi:hypothetical protein
MKIKMPGRRRRGPGSIFSAFQPGAGAQKVAVAVAAATLLFAFWPSTGLWLLLDPATLSDLRVTALVANSITAQPTSMLGFIFIVAIVGFLFADRVRMLWYTDRYRLIFVTLGTLGGLALINWLLRGYGWGLATALLMVLWFATAVEHRWGERRTLWFCLLIALSTNLVGAALLVGWPEGRQALAGGPAAALNGVGPMVDALMTVWCLMAGSRRLAILNIEAKKLVWVLVAIQVLDLVFVGAISGLMGLTAILTTWLLITGLWRPAFFLDRLRLWFIERRVSQRRRKFQIVGPKKRDRHHREHQPI